MATGIPSDPVAPADNSSSSNGQCCPSDGGGCPPDDSSSGTSFSANPVRYFNGEVKIAMEDLGSGGFGVKWGHTRSYSNQLTDQADGVNGNSWRVKEWPYVVEVDSTTVCVVVGTIYEALWFDLVSGVYVARFGVKDSLAHDVANQQYVYGNTKGEIYKFYDYSSGIATAKQGQFKSFTDTGGNETVASYGTNDLISSFVQSSGSSSSGYYYTYYSSGANAGLLQYATLQVNGANVRRAKYDYYGSTDPDGSLNDLKRVTLQQYDGSGWGALGYNYFRYYKGGEAHGIVHGLKYVIGQKSYAQMVSQGITPELATDSQMARYADNYFEYDSTSKAATLEEVGGGTQTYNYGRTSSGNANGFNNWAVKTVETLPDGSETIVYTNYAAQVMLKVFKSGTDEWYENQQYDGSGRVVLVAQSSAVASYNESSAGLVTLKANAGLIKVYDYYSSTDVPNGAVAGHLQYDKIKEGSSGTEIILKQYQYTSRTVGSLTIYPLWKKTCYPSATDQTLQLQCEIYTYTWQSGSFLIAQKTTTLPAVSAAQNGSGTADSRKEAYDEYGRVTWAMNERGYLTNWTYDVATGAVTQLIQDVDTSVVSGAPSGWTTPSGGGLNLVTDYTVDSLGRVTQELGPTHDVDVDGTNTTLRRAKWVVYKDNVHQQWEGQGYATGSSPSYSYTLINPVKITVKDNLSRVINQIEAIRSSTSGPLVATDSFPQTTWTRWTNQAYASSFNLLDQRIYFAIPSSGVGNVGVNYNVKNFGYDVMNRLNRVVTPGGTITRNVYHARGWLLSVWVGTNDNGATDDDPTGGGAPGNNMVQVQGNEYDNGNAGGDGNLTLETLYVDASTTRVTSYGYDFRNRRTSVTGEESSYTAYTYDNLDQLLQVDQRNGSVTGNLIGRKMTKYDDRGRVYQTIKYAVDPSTGTVGNSLTDNVWYDPSGNVVKRLHAGSGLFQKVEHDGINRPIMQYQAYNTSASGYPYPVNVTNDTVMQQTETDFDDASNVIQQTARNRFHNATGTGALTSPGGSQPKARVSYVAMYPDPLGRLINTANYGTNGGSSFSRPNTTPTRSATVLVSTTNYNDRGEAYQKVDPQGKVDQSAFDDAARLTQLLENYVSGGTNPDENRESDYTYNADSKVETMTAKNSVTGDQVTMWTYGVTLSNSDIASKELLRSKEYPDGGSDTVTYQYNRLGQLTGVTDQMGSVRTLEYDGLGRLTQDRVTTLGSGVDGTVRRVSRSYEIRGMLEKLTSYDNATVGSGTVINEVQYAYNSFSQLITEYQSHSGAVNTSTTPKVQYAYDDGSANTIRRTSVTYADGRVVNYDYGSSSGMNDVLSRLASLIDDDATHLADYTYLGLNQIVQVDSPQPN